MFLNDFVQTILQSCISSIFAENILFLCLSHYKIRAQIFIDPSPNYL